MSLLKPALAATAAGGALLASDDADAGLIFRGADGARRFAGRKPGDGKAPNPRYVDAPHPKTGQTEEQALQAMFKDLDELKNPDNIEKWAESRPPFFDKLPPRARENWDTMPFKARVGTLKKQAERRIADHIHNYSTYDNGKGGGWAREMQKMEGGRRNGAGYLTGVDISYEELASRFPERHQGTLEGYTRFRLGDDFKGRRTKDSKDDWFGWKLGDKEHYDGLPFQHGATKEPKISRHGRKKATGPVGFSVGAPTLGQDHLEATMHNREQKLNEHMENLGLDKDPMYEYGSLLPIKENIVTGESSLAAPEFLRDIMRGLLGLGMTPETGVYNPNDLLDVAI